MFRGHGGLCAKRDNELHFIDNQFARGTRLQVGVNYFEIVQFNAFIDKTCETHRVHNFCIKHAVDLELVDNRDV